MSESLIKPTPKISPKTIKVNLPENVVNTIQDYMSWAGFENQDNFIEKCVMHVLENDKKFNQFLKEKS